MRPAPLVLGLTLVGAGALHALAAVLDPPEIPLAEVADREGARVVVAGQVLRPREAPWGGAFDLSDGVLRVPVLLDEPPPEKHAWVRVEGVVVRWRGTPALDAERVVS